MVEAYRFDKISTGKFFSLLCKKINVELIRFEHYQSIANILIENIESAEHELVIF